MRFYTIMKGDVDIPKNNPSGISWADAGILAGAVFGILMGLSVFSFEVAAAAGVAILVFVIAKLLATKS